MDISNDSNYERLVIQFDSVEQLSEIQIVGDGTQDSNGWDGELALEISHLIAEASLVLHIPGT